MTFFFQTNYSINRMKRFAALLAVASSFIVAAPAYATSICPKGSNFGNLCNIKPDQAGNVIGAVVQILLIIAIISSLFFLIWGGVRWITSGGDKGKVDSARSTLVAAIIGLVISLLAFFILNLVLVVVTGQGISTLKIPTLYQ